VPLTDTPIAAVHDLPVETRAEVARLLQAALSDVLDAASQVKEAHWNVRGPGFLPLHELFDAVHLALAGHADLLAERIGNLGGVPVGSSRRVAAATALPEYPAGLAGGDDHVDWVVERLARLAADVRRAVDAAEHAGDTGSADLFTEVSRDLDQQRWLVASHRSPAVVAPGEVAR
jgi:starvation-inducible DNA-binding protein